MIAGLEEMARNLRYICIYKIVFLSKVHDTEGIPGKVHTSWFSLTPTSLTLNFMAVHFVIKNNLMWWKLGQMDLV